MAKQKGHQTVPGLSWRKGLQDNVADNGDESNAVNNGDVDKQDLKEQKKSLKDDRYKKDTDLRCMLSHWVVIVDSLWLSAILVILLFNRCIGLSDTVLLMLLGTTTINVLGLAFIILKGLFEAHEHDVK